ncbi:hypothetical protein KCU62_g8439, partial [Aureobasidium sp. EXF-3399]
MQTRKDEAIPSFLRETPMDTPSTLGYIKTQISAIYTAAVKIPDSDDDKDEQALHIDHDTYARIYTAVFDYTRLSDKGPKTQQQSLTRPDL